jgi:HSP20 family protein
MRIRTFYGTPTWAWRSPFEEVERMRRDLGRLFDEYPTLPTGEPPTGVFPLTNITEDKDHFYVRAELPGIKGKDIEISLTGTTLSLTGERKIATENEKVKYHRRERESGTFRRAIKLPVAIDTEKVTAKCTDGVLTVVLPKAEAAKPKQIPIKAL